MAIASQKHIEHSIENGAAIACSGALQAETIYLLRRIGRPLVCHKSQCQTV